VMQSQGFGGSSAVSEALRQFPCGTRIGGEIENLDFKRRVWRRRPDGRRALRVLCALLLNIAGA
jgi:hypothetical protein